MTHFHARPSQTCLRLAGAAALACLAGCGGGGGDDGGVSNVPPPPAPPPAVQTGRFKDLNVAGLSNASGQQSGVTGPDGRYSCETGNTVTFSVGTVTLGQAACATLATPNQLAGNGADAEALTAGLARFLQVLDVDGNPDNGIVISEAVQQMAAGWQQVDFLADDLDAEFALIRSDAASVDGTLHTLPSAGDALTHLAQTLACAYAGAYAGSFSGANSGAAGMLIGYTAPGFDFQPFGFEWQGIDAVNDFAVFGGGTGSITLTDLPAIDHTDANVAGPIQADFMSPDEIFGTWAGGDVALTRIGADNGGEYRCVGSARGEGAEAYFSLNLTGNQLEGEAFNVVDGTLFQVSGTLSGDTISIDATSAGETLTGTASLSRLPDGSPREATGTLNDGSTFGMAACRLNAF